MTEVWRGVAVREGARQHGLSFPASHSLNRESMRA